MRKLKCLQLVANTENVTIDTKQLQFACLALFSPNPISIQPTYGDLPNLKRFLYNLCYFRMMDPMFSLLYPILNRYMTGFQRFQRKINSLAENSIIELREGIMTAKKSKDGFILINQKIVNQLHLQLNAKCQFQKLIKDH